MALRNDPAGATHLVILPSYNSGSKLLPTLAAVCECRIPVHVVIDASSDGSDRLAREFAETHEGVQVTVLPQNCGKGGAVLHAMEQAAREGFTHALVMDADGQHPAQEIRPFIELSLENPDALILGVPIFGPDAPPERVKGRRVGNGFANFETLWGGIDDSLFGFRIYPLVPSIRIMKSIRTARRFDFDTELAVRLYWEGVPPVNRKVPVFYPPADEGGVTHFRYLRDNLLLTGTHIRLILTMLLFHIPRLIALRERPRHSGEVSARQTGLMFH